MSTDTGVGRAGVVERPKQLEFTATDKHATSGGMAKLFGLLRVHWMIAILVTAGLVLRVITQIAYQPALLYIDSYRYLENLDLLSTGGLNPIGYTLFLKPLLAVSGLGTVAAVQHLVGVGVAVAVYALALRFGARRWLAALAAAPMLLDAYQLQIEQLIMSDLLFEALLVAVVWVLISRGSPTQRRIIVAGLLIGASVTVRSVGITLIVPALAYLVLIGAKWRYPGGWRQIGSRVAAFVVACGVVLAGHAVYSMISTGNPGVTAQTGNVLYGRTAVVADCTKLKLDPYERQMCPDEPLGARMGVDAYAHRDGDANWPAVVPEGTNRSAMMAAFAWDVIKEQPLDVARAILVDFGKGFSPIRSTLPGDVAVERWQFQDYYPLFASQEYTDSTLVRYSGEPASVNTALAGFLRAYQLHGGYTPGPLQAAALVLGLFGSLGVASRGSGMRSTTALVTGLALTLLLTSAAFEFSWRYQLPTVSLLPLAGVLGLTALLGPLRRPKQVKHRPKLTEFPDQVDFAALTEFAERYGEPAMAPVVVVIAAYNEESGIGSVLDDVPKRALDMDVDVLVVSDGSRDATATVAREHGAYVCLAPRNRGQGAALRLAYRLAAAHGARYVVSTDADGQYDNTELDKLLCPLVKDEADFVTGSRRLGVEHAADRMRWLGVRVFAVLASMLTLRKITDTSFGFRGMRAELASSVTLREPQYQSSELLLGVLGSGARVVELPMTMLHRVAGETKKGNNLSYGCNYARVMTTTWLRAFVLRRLNPRLRRDPSGYGETRTGRAART